MNLIVVIAAVAISLLVFMALLKVVRATLSTAITIALILLLLQLAFGFNSGEFLRQLWGWWENLWRSLTR